MTEEAVEDWGDKWGRLSLRERANAMGAVRSNPAISLGTTNLARLGAHQPPPVAERAAILLNELAKRTKSLGEPVAFVDEAEMADLVPKTWSVHVGEIRFLLWKYLADQMGYVADGSNGKFTHPIVTPKGFEYLETRQRANAESELGFCAMWFDDSVQPAWTDAIDPGIRGAGYEARRIDMHQHNNKIDDEIVAMIRRSRFIVADFTGHRGGVYFEAGFAQGLGLPVIWTVREDQLADVHFDTRQYNFVLWKANALGQFKEAIRARIEATIGRGPRSD